MRKRTQQGNQKQPSNHTARLALTLLFGSPGCQSNSVETTVPRWVLHGRMSRADTLYQHRRLGWTSPDQLLFPTVHCGRVTNTQVGKDRGPIARSPSCQYHTHIVLLSATRHAQRSTAGSLGGRASSAHFSLLGSRFPERPLPCQPATPRAR